MKKKHRKTTKDKSKRLILQENKRLRIALSQEEKAHKNEVEDLQRRFARLGNDYEIYTGAGVFQAEANGVPYERIEYQAEQYGNYICVPDEKFDEMLEESKKYLARQLAEALIKNNLCQFIVRGEDINSADPLQALRGCVTIGCKIAVVPWEQLALGRRFELRRLKR